MEIKQRLINRSKKSKIGVLAFLLLGTLYLDSTMFSFQLHIGRFRPNIVIIICIGIWLLLKFLYRKKNDIKVNIIPLFFVSYIGINIISLLFTNLSPLRFSYGIKILFLLLCWLIVFFFLNDRCSNKDRALKLLKYFFIFGFLQALIGVFQMLGSFVRPTGTISLGDADYFGIAMMGYLLALLVLKTLKVKVLGNRLDYILLILLIINLFFTFVRSGWIGFLGGLVFFLFLIKTSVFGKLAFKGNKLLTLIGVIFMIVFLSFILSPSLQEYAVGRIISSAEDGNSIKNNIRFVMMEESWRNALNSPIIGNGPAAFAIQGLNLNIPYRTDFAFDPSIITTLMNDTGIVGTLIFLLFLWSLFSDVVRTFKNNPDNVLAKYALAFLISVFGLLIAYIPTTALWIPYSWVFFSLPAALSASVKSTQ